MLKEIQDIYSNYIVSEGLSIDSGKKDIKGDQKPDKNEDGRNNFKDVMISRMVKSGMSEQEAIAYVEKNYKVKPKIKVDEIYSNWRSDLREVIDDLQADIDAATEVKLKKINNYKNKAIDLNPTLGGVAESFGGEILDEIELTEDYVDVAIEIASNYFYDQGLNEDGIDLVVEEVGLDSFVDFVFDLTEDYIIAEARTLTGKKKTPASGKERGVSLKASPGKLTKAALEKHGSTRKLASSNTSGTIRKKINKDKVENAVNGAKQEQSPSTTKNSNLMSKVGNFIKTGIEKHNSSVENLRNNSEVRKIRAGLTKAKRTVDRNILPDVGGALGRAAGTTVAARKKGGTTTSAVAKGLRAGIGKLFGEDFQLWVDELLDEGYDLTEYSVAQLHETYLEEKAVSEQQQKLFGLALAYRRGETTDVSKEVIKLANSMSEKELIKYASTSHEDVPKRA